MRIYIQDKNNLLKFNLPAKVDGSMLFSFKSNSGFIENSLNIDAVNQEWVMRSNGNVNIVGQNNMLVDDIILKDYMCVPISVSGSSDLLTLFCLPSIEENNFSFDVTNKQQVTIGKLQSNSISYQQNMMFDNHAIITKENGYWFIQPCVQDERLFLYINNRRVREKTLLYTGDIIFSNGLRLIWMNKAIVVPMSTQFFKVNGLLNIQETGKINNNDYQPVSELESNVSLYSENDYFSHTPRIRSVLEKEEINIDPPPGKQDSDSEMPFFLSIGSSFTMLGMMSLNAFNLYDGLSTGQKDVMEMLPQIIMVVTMLIGSLLMPLLISKWQKNYAKKREKKRQEKYSEYLEEKEQLIQAKIKKQEQIIRDNNIDTNSCIQSIKNKNSDLWNRTIKDDDFIELRLGA